MSEPLSPPAPETPRTRRERAPAQRVPAKRGFVANLPWSMKVGVPVVAIGILVWSVAKPGPRLTVSVALSSDIGLDLTKAQLSLYPYDAASTALTPVAPSTTVQWDAAAPPILGEDSVQGEMIARIDAEGHGTNFVLLALSDDPTPRWKKLGPPSTMTAEVKLSDGRPAVGAEVVGIGGGARGAPLCETTTGPDGSFTLSGFDANLIDLTLRIRLPGHGILDYLWYFQADTQDPLVLVPTAPIRGRLVLPEALAGGSGRDESAGATEPEYVVYVRGLPGVRAPVGADGQFELDYCPTGKLACLLVEGLPPDYTYPQRIARPGQHDAELVVAKATTIRGRVVLGLSNKSLPGADVFHEDGPKGGVVVKADQDGSFELTGVPPGEVRITAQLPVPDRPPRTWATYDGTRDLRVEEGVPLENIIIRVQ